MKSAFVPFILLLVFAGVVVLSSSLYVVDETEQVIVTQFRRPVGEPVNVAPGKTEAGMHLKNSEAGLHFKLPFVQEINRFEKRIMGWEGPPNEIATRDKLYIVVDTFARWRIVDPLRYFQSLGSDESNALSRLEDIIGSESRNVIARHDLIEVVRTDKTRKPQVDETLAEASPTVGVLPAIKVGRTLLEKEVLAAAAPKVTDWGIELLDVRFKRINYKDGVIEKIYDRMVSERLQIAEKFRSEGAGEAAVISGRKERDLREIESGAYRQVQEIQGKADATATEIYSRAYNTSPAAAAFYGFVKTLDTYKTTLGADSTVILTTNSDFFKYLKSIDGGDPVVAPAAVVKPRPAVAPVAPAPVVVPTPTPAPPPTPVAPAN